MSVWRVPLLERFTCIKGEGMRHGATKYPGQYVEVDGVGLYVECPDPDYITADRVRHHLIGLRSTFCIIEADSEVELRRIFEEEWDGAKVGTRAKALRIAEEGELIRYPECKKRHKNKAGEYICGEAENDEDEYSSGCGGMCAISGYDAPEDCPINEGDKK